MRFNPGDVKGPVSAAVAVSGKLDEKAARETRIVVFGSSLFAANKFERLGLNSDLFLNTAGWLLEDENSITIRPKEKRQGFIELTKQEQQIIFWLCVVLVPAFLIVGGVANWWRRRKL